MTAAAPHQNRAGGMTSGWGRGAAGFWRKVYARPDGCWDWTGYLDKDGAGKFCTLVDGRPRTFRAARYAWEQLIGPIPAGRVLLAVICWNPRCVRPAHREPVPHVDVVRWIYAVGRPVEAADNRGEMCGRAKLTEDAVRELRQEHRHSRRHRGLLLRLYSEYGPRYGVSHQAIQNVVYNRTWRHLGRCRGPERAHNTVAATGRVPRQTVFAGGAR